GNFRADFPALVRSRRFIARLPPDIIQFLREKVPPNQIVIGQETETIVLSTTHYAAIYSVAGQPLHPSIVANWRFLQQFPEMNGMFDLRRLIESDDESKLLRKMIDLFSIDIIIAMPAEAPVLADASQRKPRLRSLIEPIFSHQGYVVYRVN